MSHERSRRRTRSLGSSSRRVRANAPRTRPGNPRGPLHAPHRPDERRDRVAHAIEASRGGGMNGLGAAFLVEFLKARRSRSWGIAAGFSVFPIVGGFFMLILKDPERARQLGLLGAKRSWRPERPTGRHSWRSSPRPSRSVAPSCSHSSSPGSSAGSSPIERCVISSPAPTSRSASVIAKMAVGSLWSMAIVGWMLGLALAIGLAIDGLVGLPGWSGDVVLRGFAGRPQPRS